MFADETGALKLQTELQLDLWKDSVLFKVAKKKSDKHGNS